MHKPRQIALARLHPAEWNANRVRPAILAKVRRSIERFGLVENLVARPHPELGEGHYEVLSGNHRLEILRDLGHAKAPVVVVDVDDTQARLLAQTLNRTRGTDDPVAYAKLLDDVLRQLDHEGALELLPETNSSLERALRSLPDRDIGDVDDAPAPPARARSKRGKVYELGPHRLLCGDATDPEALDLLLAGDQAQLLLTDPPYGVDYGDKNDFLNRTGSHVSTSPRASRDILNDDLGHAELAELLRAAFTIAAERTIKGGPFYVFCSEWTEPLFRVELAAAGWRYAQTLIWVKSNWVPGRTDYHFRHEPVIYGWRPGAAHRWYGGYGEGSVLDDDTDLRKLSKDSLRRALEGYLNREGTTVLAGPKPAASELHPTMKPVWLLERLISNSSDRGDIVLDPFAGSGSTLIAADQLGRRCYAAELDPRYCDVIRRRYEAQGRRAA